MSFDQFDLENKLIMWLTKTFLTSLSQCGIIQRRAIRREFEPVGPTLLKDTLGAGWGLLPILQWVGSWFFRQVERRYHNRESNRQPLCLDLSTSSLSSTNLGSSRTISVWYMKGLIATPSNLVFT